MAFTSEAVIITGAYPTSTPATLGATKAIPSSIVHIGVSAEIVLTAGTATIYLLGYNTTSTKWHLLISGAGDSAVDGGHIKLADDTVRQLDYSDFALWEKTSAAPTYTPATKGYITQH